MGSLGRKGRIVMGLLIVPVALLAILMLGLLLVSPGRPSPVVDERSRPVEGSLSEKLRVSINGVEQGMFIRGRDPEKPLLLFLHGGAGMPEYFLFQQYSAALRVLEEQFIVCFWERRGAGLSFSSDVSPRSMRVDQIVADTVEVSRYLTNRFHKEKVYLMAHSGGTFFAIQAVARAPELFHAYMPVGQIAYQLESENRAYEYMLARYRELGDKSMVSRLESSPPAMSVPLPRSYMLIRDKAMHGLGVGTTRRMRSVIAGVFLPSLISRDYTLAEKVKIWRGKAFSDALLWDTILATDLTKEVPRVEVPVYFLHGVHDYTVTLEETKAYFEALEAPLKGFYTFSESAHSPMFEEPERLRSIIVTDILAGTADLADRL